MRILLLRILICVFCLSSGAILFPASLFLTLYVCGNFAFEMALTKAMDLISPLDGITIFQMLPFLVLASYSLFGKFENVFKLLFLLGGGLTSLLIVSVLFYESAWKQIYIVPHPSSTAGIAMLFIPIYNLAFMVLGIYIGKCMYKLMNKWETGDGKPRTATQKNDDGKNRGQSPIK